MASKKCVLKWALPGGHAGVLGVYRDTSSTWGSCLLHIVVSEVQGLLKAM